MLNIYFNKNYDTTLFDTDETLLFLPKGKIFEKIVTHLILNDWIILII